jgi:hypothetical protein
VFGRFEAGTVSLNGKNVKIAVKMRVGAGNGWRKDPRYRFVLGARDDECACEAGNQQHPGLISVPMSVGSVSSDAAN